MKEKQYEGYIISMIDFLKEFVGIETQLELLRKATHKDIKQFNFDNVKAVPFELVSKESIYTGDIILVRDGKKNLAPYINPNRLIKHKKRERKIENDKY